MTAWFASTTEEDLERVLAAWPDAPEDREEVLAMLLDVARTQVIAYAQGLPDDAILTDYKLVNEDGVEVTEIPGRLVYAQLQQAINLWNAGRVSSNGDLGVDTYTFTPRPLDKTIRSVIRPMGVPSVV